MDHLTLALTTRTINLSSLNKSILVLSETEEPQNAWWSQDVPLAVTPHSCNLFYLGLPCIQFTNMASHIFLPWLLNAGLSLATAGTKSF